MLKSENKINPRLLIMLTNECNLRCKLCNIWQEKRKSTLCLPVLRRIVDTILDNSEYISCLGITGGEPFLKGKALLSFFINIGSYLKAGKIKHFNITTNGTFPEQIREFVSLIPEVFLRRISFNISLDGMKKSHNYLRDGGDIFEKVLKSAIILRKRGIKVVFNFVISHFNAKDIYATTLLSKKLGCAMEFELFSRDLPSYYHYYKKSAVLTNAVSGWERTCMRQMEMLFEEAKSSFNATQVKVLYEYLRTGSVDNNIIASCLTPSRLIFIRCTGEVYSCPYERHIGHVNNFNWNGFSKERYALIENIRRSGCAKCISTMGALGYVT